MKSSIYISSEKIGVMGYSKRGKSVSIKAFATYPLPEGTMMNGKITDHAQLVECLTAMRGDNPKLFTNPTLIVDGSFVFSKKIVAPKLSKKQYGKLVRDDFSDTADELGELVCDYHMLGGTNGAYTAILACASEKAQVESYISVFKDTGIKLKAIRVGVQAIINYVSSNPELTKTTFVLNVIEGVTMLSMIFENGINVFLSRTRLYSEEHDRFIQEILENLSGLIQFNKSEKFSDIAYSYYLGLNDEDLRFMNALSPYLDIKLETLKVFGNAAGAGTLEADSHFAYLNALLSNDSIDFIRSYKMLDKLKKQQRPKRLWIPALVCISAALAIPTVYLFRQISNINNGIQELNGYMTSEPVMAKSAELDQITSQTSYYNDIVNQIKAKTDSENSKASISNQVIDLITQTSGDKVTVSRFEFGESTGIMRVNGSSATETDSAEYVESLKKSSLIKSIYYTGYSYNKEGVYNFSIDVELAAREVNQ